MIGLRRGRFSLVVLAVSLLASAAGAAGMPALEPSWGKIHRNARVLGNPGEVLWIIPRPGAEDFEAIASLREMRGTRSQLLFMTNGEAAPDDRAEWSLAITAGRRKEEALSSARVLGGDAYYGNLPDRAGSWPFVPRANLDTAVVNIARVIRMVRPSMVILARDRVTGLGSRTEDSLFTDLLRQAIALAGEKGIMLSTPLPSARVWKVPVFMTPASPSIRSVTIGPSRSSATSVTRVAAAARGAYESLSAQLQPMPADRYTQSDGKIPRGMKRLGDGVMPVSSKLKGTLREMQKISVGLERTRNLRRARSLVDEGYRHVEEHLQSGLSALPEQDVRTIVSWKGTLDEIQYELAAPGLSVTVSDTLLIGRQVFMINVSVPKRVLRQGTTQIMFQLPADDRWIVNESLKRLFDLQKDSVFRVVTPLENQLSYPVPTFGLNALLLREPFRFAIIHDAPTSAGRFISVREVPLGFAAKDAGVILTPAVLAGSDDPVVIDSYNFSRDSTTGFYWVHDSLCTGTTHEFRLPKKGSVSRDTLSLAWDSVAVGSDHVIDIHAGRVVVGQVLGRAIAAPSLEGRTVGLRSPRRQSAIGSALRRMGAHVVPMEGSVEGQKLADLNDLVIDRGARLSAEDRTVLLAWARRGGNLVVAGNPDATWRFGSDSLWFAFTDPIPTTDTLAATNLHTRSEGSGATRLIAWGVSPAWQQIRWSTGLAPQVQVKSPEGHPLVASLPLDEGRIVFVSLSMAAQLQMMNPDFFAVLATTLERRK